MGVRVGTPHLWLELERVRRRLPLAAGILGAEAAAALAGGINVMVWRETTVGICQLQALSPVGRCKSFDASADGYGRGEGFAMVLLAQPGVAGEGAARAVLRGSAVNQDGRSSSLTAPNGPAQQALVAAALLSGGLPPLAVGLVAVHGTGGPLLPLRPCFLRGTVLLAPYEACAHPVGCRHAAGRPHRGWRPCGRAQDGLLPLWSSGCAAFGEELLWAH